MCFISSYILSAAGRAERIYTDSAHLRLCGRDLPLIWIRVKHPNAEWTNVWGNIVSTPLPDETRSTWYRVIYDLIPTQVRLHDINIQNTGACVQCTNVYTLLHTQCALPPHSYGNGNVHRNAAVICTDPRYVPPQWLLLPDTTFLAENEMSS